MKYLIFAVIPAIAVISVIAVLIYYASARRKFSKLRQEKRIERELALGRMSAAEADKKIRLCEALTDKAEEEFSDNISDDEEKKHDAVMRLFDQGWSIEEIAKTLRLSVGEVEMIRDLNMVTR